MVRLMQAAMVLGMVLMSTSFTTDAGAEDRVGFSVEAELPDNQVDTSVTYYDLRVERNHEQTLTLTIYNHENEELTVNGEVLNASTNSNGLVVYEEKEVDESLTEPVTELVELSANEWTIPAGESRTIETQINMNDTTFDGIKLGGLHFQKADAEVDEAEGVSIQNKYAYVIGVRLSQNDETVDPELELASVIPGLVNYRTAVTANVRNTQPVMMSEVSITADVFREEETSPLRTVEQEGIRMAPNSVMPFIINWENEPLEAGEYRLEMTATDGENKWQWDESFQISAEDETINEEAVELEDEQSINYWFIAGIAVLLIIIAGLIFYIRRLKKQSKK
ncbi:DUF916 and DUF3324 domain-containing protein [Salinicoccus hispanicus]|uniref:DUF3324 domain-containing protein n=1 Tax=Salinicoccus hispanicus TaxID=157225 RepID=A0A6N8TYK2_9STAP|nr:DUF916 and DUF3324 domain-containing protein [Salinicoccus hispanicus]MXQ51078.1 DUF3324 domain-containing protein [Salinicoccus hispanicus]